MLIYWLQVWFILCFWTVEHLAQDLADIEGFSNDSPFNVEPKVENIKVKVGTPINLKCANHLSNHTVWEYKECEILYKGIVCNLHDLTKPKVKDKDSWKRQSTKQRLEIDSMNKADSGLYRCLEKGVVKKSLIIEVVADSYEGPPPSVQSLLTSNITNQLNMEFTIQCNVTSVIPPTVIWFKKCYGSKCDIDYDGICYCHLNITASSYNIGNTYISKMNIFNAKEIDSGLYACLAVTEYGKDYKYVTITVPDVDGKNNNSNSFPLLFLIPLALIIVPLLVWLCYFRRKTKKPLSVVNAGQQRQNLLSLSASRAAGSMV
ncbi:titin homolog isoform X2 [Dendroctonus ponderosae]|uniref:titin homolog isoform X2 n=1 Tax=Dendroctonus ponderosae TaxID=77166 RepID=UPI00203562B7|nr:titin homolog isoform X2 [Dendroctonus ponderosae]